MVKHLPVLQTVILAASLLWLTACSPQAPATLDADIDPTGTSVISAPVPTLTGTPTLAPTKTPLIPTIWPARPITPDNAKSIRQIKSWGRGSVLQIRKLAHKPGELLVLTPFGLYWYGNTAPYLLAFLPEVDDFVLSSNERWLAVSGKNGDVEIWDTDSLSLEQAISHAFPDELLQKIEDKEIMPFYVGGMAFSSDGTQFALGYVDGKIELWRLGEAAPYATLQHDALALWKTDAGLLFQLSFSPNGKVLTAFKFAPYLNANRLTFWSLPEASLLSVSEAGRYYEIPETAYLPDGKTMLVFARDDSYLQIQLWDVETGKMLDDFATGFSRIDSTALAAGGDRLTVVGSDKQDNIYRQVWSLPEGERVENEELDQLPKDEELSDFKEFLLGQGHYDNAWGSGGRAEQARLIHEGTMPIQVLEEGYVLRLPDGITVPADMPGEMSSAYYDPLGNFIAWCEPGKLIIRDKSGATASTQLPFNSNCNGVVVSPQKHYAALWNSQGLYIQDLETGKYSKPAFDLRWRNSLILAARFSEDGQILITSMMGLITVWQVDPLQKIADSHNEDAFIGNNLKISISKDKTTAVTLSISRGSTSDRSSQLLVWRVADGFPLHRINPLFIGEKQPMFTSFALSPDASLIASGDDFGSIRFWSVKSGEQLTSYDAGHLPLDLAFTPEGAGLVVIFGDGTTRLFGVP